MNFCKIDKWSFTLFIFLYLFVCGYLLVFTPLMTSEANLIYSPDFTLSKYLANFALKLFHTNYGVRLPFFIISLLSTLLIYRYSKSILNKSSVYLALFLYLVTPGVFVSTIIISWATIPIFLSILLVVAIKEKIVMLQILSLVLLFFTHTAVFVLYLAIVIYGYKKHNVLLFVFSLFLFIISTYLNKYSFGGIPRGHLLQLFGIYAVIFSPFYFMSLIYAIYRIGKDRVGDVLWYIVAISFVVSLILAIRQKILVTDFTPFIVFASPLIVLVFQNSLSVRLPIFRTKYYFICKLVVVVLLLETLLVAFNYPIYRYMGKKLYIIDTSIYIVAQKAQSTTQKCIKDTSNRYKNLYKFYNLKKCN